MTICQSNQVVGKEEIEKKAFEEKLNETLTLKDLLGSTQDKLKKAEFTTRKRYSKKKMDEEEFEKIEAEEIIVLPKRKKPRKKPTTRNKKEEGGEA